MLRLCVLILGGLLCPLLTQAQYCPENTSLGSTVDVWDWREETFEVYLKNVTTNNTEFEIIDSPFHGTTVSQPNTNHLRIPDYKEYEPSRGWELVIKEFGQPENGVRMPFLVLYNRFTGKLRMLYYLADEADIQTITLGLKHLKLDDTQIEHINAVLEHAFTPMDVVEGYIDKSITIETMNSHQENAGIWLYADIPTAYDPCVCQYTSGFETDNFNHSTQELNINLDGEGSLEQVMADGSPIEDMGKSFNINNFGSVVSKGSKAYKSINKFLTDADKGFAKKLNGNMTAAASLELSNMGINEVKGSNINDIMSAAGSGSNPGISNLVNGLTNTGIAGIAPPWLKTAVPYIGAAMGVLEFFSGGSSEPPLNFSIDLDFVGEGEITLTSPLASSIFLAPGSDNDGIDEALIPIYNNPLGVANIMETPVINHASEVLINQTGGYGIYYLQGHSYRLRESIKYAFNPSTGLTIDEIRGAIYFTGCFDFDEMTNLVQEERIITYVEGEAVERSIWRTPYMSLACLEEYTVYMERSIQGSYTTAQVEGPYCEGDMNFHFIVNTGHSFYSSTYRAGQWEAPYTYAETPENPWMNVPTTITTDDIDGILDGEITAWGDIIVEGDIVITEENIDEILDLYPTTYTTVTTISDNPDEASSIQLIGLTPDLKPGETFSGTFNVQNPPDCGERPPVSSSYLNSFCKNSNKYNPVALSIVGKTEIEDTNVESESFISISPNPTNGPLNIEINLAQEEIVSMKISDSSGKVISDIFVEEKMPKGQNNTQFSIENLSNGMYLLEVSTSNENEVFKIVKQ